MAAAPQAEDVVWQLNGSCTRHDPEIFQPTTLAGEIAAKQICQGCPVRVQCQAWAVDHHELAGVWGGLSESDREYIWTGRRRQRYRRSYRQSL